VSAVLTPAFGDRRAIRNAEMGNAAYERALKMGYSRISALQFARRAKAEHTQTETPAQVALRIVPPKQRSATVRGPFNGGTAA
jgi:hypothetical protein